MREEGEGGVCGRERGKGRGEVGQGAWVDLQPRGTEGREEKKKKEKKGFGERER